MRNGKRNDVRMMSRLVWSLSCVGMGAGIVTLGFVYHALSAIRHEHQQTEAVQTGLAGSVQSLQSEREAVFRDVNACFTDDLGRDRTASHTPDHLFFLVSECKRWLANGHVEDLAHHQNTETLDGTTSSLCRLYDEIKQWERETASAKSALQRALEQARQTTAETMAVPQKLAGQQRLKRGVLIRRYHRANENDKTDLAFQIVNGIAFSADIDSLKLELGELAVLTERLHGETEIDNLVSLKDNEIRQTIARMRLVAQRNVLDAGRTMTSRIAAIQESIFGTGSVDDSAHQTLLTGQGGLFLCQQRTLALEAEGRSLRTRLSANQKNFLAAERVLGLATDKLSTSAAHYAEGRLNRAWQHVLATGCAVAVVFLILSWRLANLGRNTERKLHEQNASLEDQRRQLETQSQEILRVNTGLEKTKTAAEAATRAKSEFLANMSHEIRTPMTAILGFSDILMTSKMDQEQLDAATTIKQNGGYLLGIINDILDLSKIEAGKLEVEHIQCSPCQVLSDVASLMRVRANAKNLPLKVEYDGPIPQTIQSDPTRLRQILINLTGNAIKFTEVGEVRLVARLLDADSDDPKLQIAIADSGIGMTPEQISSLFTPFQQADTSTTRKFGGTGLGLTISKRLAEKLGGDITVTSTIGKGSTFAITVGTGSLDGVKRLDNATEAQIPTDSDRNPTEFNGNLDCRVLLAEDGPDNQRLISFLLRKAGADVTVADNGQVAHDLALAARDEGTHFDVILMDMQMPVMDGYNATGTLREANYTGPIIALTAHAMNADRKKCLNAGCDDYLTKPIDRLKLISTVAQYASAKEMGSGTISVENGVK